MSNPLGTLEAAQTFGIGSIVLSTMAHWCWPLLVPGIITVLTAVGICLRDYPRDCRAWRITRHQHALQAIEAHERQTVTSTSTPPHPYWVILPEFTCHLR